MVKGMCVDVCMSTYKCLLYFTIRLHFQQPWELGKKYGNFIFTFAIAKDRYGGITTAKIFKHGNYLKYLLYFVFY